MASSSYRTLRCTGWPERLLSAEAINRDSVSYKILRGSRKIPLWGAGEISTEKVPCTAKLQRPWRIKQSLVLFGCDGFFSLFLSVLLGLVPRSLSISLDLRRLLWCPVRCLASAASETPPAGLGMSQGPPRLEPVAAGLLQTCGHERRTRETRFLRKSVICRHLFTHMPKGERILFSPHLDCLRVWSQWDGTVSSFTCEPRTFSVVPVA